MKKIFFPALLVAVFLGLSPAHALSGKDCTPPKPPGCDCGDDGKGGIAGMMENQSQLQQSMNNGNSKQTLTQPEKAEKLACMDQAIAKITGSLGNMFSNMALNPQFSMGGTNTAFCGLVSYPSLPTTNLAWQLSSMIPNLAGLLPAFSVQLCTPNPPSIPIPHTGFGGSIGGCNIAASIGLTPPKLPPPKCLKITTPGMNCLAIKSKWSGNKGSIEQNGIVMGTPYMTPESLLKSFGDSTSANMEKLGNKYKRQIDNDRAILTRAKNDMENMKGPGFTKAWKKPPSFGANASVGEIIEEMGKNPSHASSTGASATLPFCGPVLPDTSGLSGVTSDISSQFQNLVNQMSGPNIPPFTIPAPQTNQLPNPPPIGDSIGTQSIPGVNCIPTQ